MQQTIIEKEGNFEPFDFDGAIPPVGSKLYIRLEKHYHSCTECEVTHIDYGIMQFAYDPKLNTEVITKPNGETDLKDIQRNNMRVEIYVKICNMESFKMNEKNQKETDWRKKN